MTHQDEDLIIELVFDDEDGSVQPRLTAYLEDAEADLYEVRSDAEGYMCLHTGAYACVTLSTYMLNSIEILGDMLYDFIVIARGAKFLKNELLDLFRTKAIHEYGWPSAKVTTQLIDLNEAA